MNQKCKYLLVSFLFILLLAGCGPKPDEVALLLAEAVNAGDLEQALALFAEDAVVTSVSPEPFRGKTQIQGWLEGMIADDFELQAEIAEVSGNKVVEQDTMTMDSMSFFGIEPLTGTSELVVENGKIQTLNFSFSEETLDDMQSAPFVAPEELLGIWSVGTLIQFNDDGTSRVANNLEDLSEPLSEVHPGSLEAWTYDGMVMTFQALEPGVGEGYTCTPDEVGVYLVRWAGADLDQLKFEPIDDPCGARMGGMMWGNWKPVDQPAADETATAEAIVKGFIEAQNAGIVEGALAFLADDAVVQIIPPPEPAGDGVFTGKEEIRGWYEFLAGGHGSNELSNVQVNGDQVMALIRFSDDGLKEMGVDFLDYAWAVTIKDGKIQSYTATVTEESMEKLMAAVAALEAAQTE
jgi:ketosteroid isomerase-like protein